mmetsp:Transcript_35868/g.61174  ORF Transcript_35868/g.61174 Transcript_35868/m.61174 type:complete len:407 (-) Transcript_35868:62-1282(-)
MRMRCAAHLQRNIEPTTKSLFAPRSVPTKKLKPGMSVSSSASSNGPSLSSHLNLNPLPGGGDDDDDGTPPCSSTYHFGRIAEDIDLSRASLSARPALQREIVKAVYEHGLIVFRNQAHLSPRDEVAFAELFTHQPDDADVSYTGGAGTQHRLPDHPSVALVGSYRVHDFYGLTASSPGVYGHWHPDQRAWHCDGLADTHPPPDLTTMRCIKTPSIGGETLFASSVRAAELLPTELLVDEFGMHPEDVRVNYKLFDKYKIAREGTHLEEAEGAKGETREGGWDVNLSGGTSVPLVIRERHTGRKSMVGTYHVASIVSSSNSCSLKKKSLGFRDANAYLAKAWKPGLSEENVYKHRWRVGDLAAWSNRLVIHTATSTKAYDGQERLHTRIRMRSLEEDAPIPWKIQSS